VRASQKPALSCFLQAERRTLPVGAALGAALKNSQFAAENQLSFGEAHCNLPQESIISIKALKYKNLVMPSATAMNLRRPTRQGRSITILAVGMLLLSLSSYALDYNPMDLLLCFRVATGGTDTEVDLGSATNFNSLPAGSVLTITNYSQASLQHAYGGDYTTLNWAAFAEVGAGNTGNSSPAYPLYSIWATSPRQNPLVESTPWIRRSAEGGGTMVQTQQAMYNVGYNATTYSGEVATNATKNNATTVLISSGSAYSYSFSQNLPTGAPGSFGGKWEGDIENVTPGESAPVPWISRSDLFFMAPGSGPGTFLGYFQFSETSDNGVTNGITTFHASDGPPPGIDNILTAAGPLGGGTSVTLTGTNFFDDTNLIVEFGGVPATSVTFNSSTSVTVTTPPGTATGPVDVYLINSDGQYTLLASGFTYTSGQSGDLQVTIDPPAVVSAGAEWKVDGGPLETNDAVVFGLDPSTNHTVSFSAVDGWTAPANQVVTVTNGATNTITATYVQQFGSLTVTILPAAAVLAGAQWQVDGGPLQASGVLVSGLAVADTHVITFSAATGFATPAAQIVSLTNGATTSLTVTYLQPSADLEVTILPPGAVAAGAEWELDNSGIFETNGEVLFGLNAATNHIVTFTNLPGWITPASQIVSVTNGTTNIIIGTYVQETGSLQVMIQPPAVVTASAEWQVDGGEWQTNGAIVSGLTILANHTIVFTNVALWTTPSNQIVSITNSATNIVTATYVSQAGALQVTIDPPTVVSAGAEWQVNGGAFLASGAVAGNLSPGANTVSFKPVADWNTPESQSVSISTGVTSSLIGTYTYKKKGNPSVTITSPKTTTLSLSNDTLEVTGTAKDLVSGVAITAVYYELNGSSWNLAGTTNSWTTWYASVTLTPGENSIRAYVVDISGAAHTNVAFNFKFIPSAILTVQTIGSGKVTPSDNGALLSIGANYTLKAEPGVNNLFSNWVGGASQPYSVLGTNASLTFAMQSNLVLQANFVTNFFLAAEGPYHGLFAPANEPRTQSNSGAFTLTVTSAGALSGTLDIGSASETLSGHFNVSGAALIQPVKGAKIPLTTFLQLDLADDSVEGTVSNSSFTAILSGNQNVFSTAHKATNYEGAYTFIIPGTNEASVGPLGTSVGTATVADTGTITFSVYLADGSSAVAQSSVVSKEGFWPFYVALNSGQGSIWGWNYFGNGAVVSAPDLSWISATNATKTDLYRSGFTNQNVQVTGSAFNATEKPALDLSSGQVTLEAGDLAFSITNEIDLASNNTITVPTAAKDTNKLVLTISKTGNGLISGSFANPSEPKQTIKINGVLLQNQTNAFGYFLGTNESGLFFLQNSN
jgi:hypothetical protein